MKWMNEITGTVEEVLNGYVDFFKGLEVARKVQVFSECRVPNVSGTTYLEILLKEDMLDEEDIDLLTIEINYDIKDGVTAVRCEVYFNNGIILNTSYYCTGKEEINVIKKELTSFMTSFIEGIKEWGW